MDKHGGPKARVASELFGAFLLLGLGWAAWPGLREGCEVLLLPEVAQSAIDLRIRLAEVAHWFAGTPIYETDAHAVYPPAGFLVLRGLMLVPELGVARVAWFVESMVCALVLGLFAARASGLHTRSLQLGVLAAPLLLVGTQDGLGNGQLHLFPVVLGGASVLLLAGSRVGWARDLLAAALFALALSKPSVTLPLAWLVLFVPGRLRPALLVVGLYAALTVIAALPQAAPLGQLGALWLERAIAGAANGAEHGGRANTQTLVQLLGWAELGPLLVIGWWSGLGAWLYGQRRADPLLLLGIAGLVSRLSMYHRGYDDVLVIPALLACLRVARGVPLGSARPRLLRLVVGLLGACTFLAMWVPSAWFADHTPPFALLLALWLLDLVALVAVCASDAHALADPVPAAPTAAPAPA